MDIKQIGSAEDQGYNLYATVVKKRCPVEDYLDSLPEKDIKAVVALFRFITQNGPPKNREKFRSLGDEIYELKSKGIRILCFFGGNILPKSLILTHGFKKPKKKVLQREKKKATNYFREYSKGGNIIIIS